MLRFRSIVTGLLAPAIVLAAAAAWAQPFPSKPVSIVVAFPPGGGHDFFARLLAKELGASLGQPVIVENVPGAGGTIGISKAIKAPADGHTLMVTTANETVLGPLTFQSAHYKAEDLRTIAFGGKSGIALVARKDLPASNLAEFAALLKASSARTLAYCTPGIGSQYHLIGERLAALAGAAAQHVPYSGLTQCVNDLIGGTTVDFALVPIAGPFPGFIDKGTIKPIAVLSGAPSTRLPKVPLASATPGFESLAFTAWAAVQVSAHVPDRVVDLLHRHVSAALAKPELRAAMETSGSPVPPQASLQQAQQEYLNEIRLYTSIAKAVGLQRK
jgi:tripartite-type tricarboxylate transporter receptor subunit TctC